MNEILKARKADKDLRKKYCCECSQFDGETRKYIRPYWEK